MSFDRRDRLQEMEEACIDAAAAGGGSAGFSFSNLKPPQMASSPAAPGFNLQAMSACSYNFPPPPTPAPPQRQRGNHAGPSQFKASATAAAGDVEAIKNKIASHPQYTALLAAYLECQKVGAPQEVVDRLTVVGGKIEAARRCRQPDATSDPELDQFMEAYCNMLVRYRAELTRPIEEAMDYLKKVEAQLSSLTDGGRVFPNPGTADAMGPPEAGAGCGATGEIDPQAEDKELKYQLLTKYSGYLSSLRQEFSKKKKKGKLPKDARQKLLSWWEMHYKWPYPSEVEKMALAESTGLDQKQINNWFINQRKRHWKPSDDMPLFMMEGYHPHVVGVGGAATAAGFYMDGPFLPDRLYRPGS